jgi:hypothetical protein
MSTMLLAPGVRSQNLAVTPYEADASFNAFNTNFLVQSDDHTFYNLKLNSAGIKQAKLWVQALDIAVAEDAYKRTRSPATLQLVKELLNTFETRFGVGKDWSYDGWNDDIGWMVNAFLRGYQMTGNTGYLDIAKQNYDMAIQRGWDNTLGGGIYENDTKKGKECLSNDPFVWEGVWLYQATGDSTYLTEAETIYDWVRSRCFNYTDSTNAIGVPGRLRQGVWETGSLEGGDNFYNSGTFLADANILYQATGKSEYYDDGVHIIMHVIGSGPILHNGSEGEENQWAYWFVKGLSDFCTDNNLWPTYYPWFLGNANAAWSERDSLNLTWNDWTAPTNDSVISGLSTESAVAVWQGLDVPQQYLIVNGYSGLAMDLTGSNQTANAAINQSAVSSSLDPDQHWMLVPEGGHYAIVSAETGMAATILSASTTNGAQLVDSPFSINDTSMEFDKVPVGNGWFLLKNVDSGLMLDDLHAGTSDGTPIVQWSSNGLRNQMWKIKPFVSFGGQYEIQCVENGNALGVPEVATGSIATVTPMPFKGVSNQRWTFTPTSSGYYILNNVKSGEQLGVTGDSFSDGAAIVEQPTGTALCNQWLPVQSSTGTWSFFNLNSGLVLEDTGGTAHGVQLDQGHWGGGPNQQFNLIPIRTSAPI